MGLLLPRSAFFHVPRTGGSAIRRALEGAGLAKAELRCKTHMYSPYRDPVCCLHNTVNMVDEELIQDVYTFAFVRHPLSWYQSAWCLRTLHQGWKDSHGDDRVLRSDTFSGFLENVLEHRYSYISKAYRRFFRGERQLSFVGRYENLKRDLVKALTEAGEEFNVEAVVNMPVVNHASQHHQFQDRCLYSHELHAAICESEKESMEYFDYSASDVPSYDESYIRSKDKEKTKAALLW